MTPDFIAGNSHELNDNGAWSWFMDERLHIHGRHLVVGSVRSTDQTYEAGAADPDWGNIEIAVYDLEAKRSEVVVLHRHLEQDDHDGPALLVRPDERWLAVYTQHSQERKVYYRISEPHDPTRWGPVHELETPGEDHPPFGGDNVTYSNLFTLTSEHDRVYNFFRSLAHQQNWMTSADHGDTWRYGGMFLRGHQGYAPYFKYATNHRDTIHFIGTEDHPRNFDNSVYHGYLRGGQVFHSDGRPFAPLSQTSEKTGDIWDLTPVYRGDADHVAWVHDLRLDSQETPVCVFSVQRDGRGLPPGQGGMDHRYHYARWDGESWRQHEIGFAGTRLYPGEDDYTGGIALHRGDLQTVFISTDADPVTDEPLISAADGRRHHELFRGHTDDHGANWAWVPITANSRTDNLRPLVSPTPDGRTAVVWMRGRYEHNRGPWSTAVMLTLLD